MNEFTANTLSATNVFLALLVVFFQFRMLNRCRQGQPPWCWLRIGLLLIGLYWAGLYLYVLYPFKTISNSVWFGQVFVRPAFTLTLAMMAASAIQRGRSIQ